MSTPSHTAFTEESNMEVWISKHGRNILYGILGIALVVLVVVQLSRSQETKAHGDYLKAETAFQAFSAAQETAPRMEAFAELKEVLGRRPELLPRYEGMIAQELFAHDLGKEAAPYAQTVLKRQHLPDYYEFATTSLLIADGRYDEALRQTEVLKAKLLSETSEAACMLRNFAA